MWAEAFTLSAANRAASASRPLSLRSSVSRGKRVLSSDSRAADSSLKPVLFRSVTAKPVTPSTAARPARPNSSCMISVTPKPMICTTRSVRVEMPFP